MARGFVKVPWYGTVRQMIEGLQKNTFAFVHYRLSFLVPIIALLLLVNILPLWGVLFCAGTVKLLWLTTLGMKLAGISPGSP